MSFGFSIGDFIAVGTLAWNLYQSSRHASAQFQELGRECLSIHIAIKQTETGPDGARSLLDEKASEDLDGLGQLSHNCKETLGQLDAIITKYRSLGTLQKRQWDRIRFGREQLDEIRSKLTLHLTAINTFFDGVQLTMMARLETKIDQIALDIRRGIRAPSELSMGENDNDLHWVEDDYLWRQLKIELEEEGITSSDIEKEKETIKAYIRHLFLNQDFDTNTLQPEDSMSMTFENAHNISASNNIGERENMPSLASASSGREDPVSFGSFHRDLEADKKYIRPGHIHLEADENLMTPEVIEALTSGVIEALNTTIAQSEQNLGIVDQESSSASTTESSTSTEESLGRPEAEGLQNIPSNLSTQVLRLNVAVKEGSNAVQLETGLPALRELLLNVPDVINFLREKGCIVRSANFMEPAERDVALLLGAKYCHQPTIRLMLSQGANVETRDEKKRTPLHLATISGSLRSVKLLVENNSSIDRFDSD